MMLKDFTIKFLVDSLAQAEVIKYKNYRSARQHVQYFIKNGRLQLRRNNRNNYYLVNVSEVREIIKALSSTGVGYWHAKL